MNENHDELPPHDFGAEKAVLGCVLLDATLLPRIAERFRGEKVFYSIAHQTIFDTMVNMQGEGKAIDGVTLRSRLKEANNLDAVGGAGFISELPDQVPGASNFEF